MSEALQHLIHLGVGSSSTGSPISEARQYCSHRLSTSTLPATARSKIGAQRHQAVIGHQAGRALLQRRQDMSDNAWVPKVA
jgi:hypothetical protein